MKLIKRSHRSYVFCFMIICIQSIGASYELNLRYNDHRHANDLTKSTLRFDELVYGKAFINDSRHQAERSQFDRIHTKSSRHQDATSDNFNLPKLNSEGKRRHLFRIGLIVPKTAFVSLYKTYTQRIKDTFAHLLQLSRHKRGTATILKETGKRSSGSIKSNALRNNQQNFLVEANKLMATSQASSCLSRESPFLQKHRRLSWPNLTFNQYFDIEVANLVNLAPRSSAQEIIDSVCHKLIEQNVSVIIYLENNQDHDISALDSQTAYRAPAPAANSTFIRPQMHSFSVGDQLSSLKLQSSKGQNDKTSATPNMPADSITVQLNQSESLPVGGGVSNEVQQTSSQAHFIMHLAHSAGIPMIAWSMTAALAQRPKTRRTLHLAPTVAHEARAMLAIMDRYSWYSFSVVTTTLVGYEDFILAFKQSIAAAQAPASQGSGLPVTTKSTSDIVSSMSNLSSATTGSDRPLDNNTVDGEGANRLIGRSQTAEATTAQASTNKGFRLVDIIKIKRRSLEHIEEELKRLTFSESRIILLYSTKGEAADIFKVAKKLRLTKRSYAWIVAQSVIGPDESEEAPVDFHPGLLGIYFRSNHERLLDELSRAITIIAHGLERFVRDEQLALQAERENSTEDPSNEPFVTSNEVIQEKMLTRSVDNFAGFAIQVPHLYGAPSMVNGNLSNKQTKELHRAMIDHRKKLLSVQSRCQGSPNPFSEQRGDLLYEYFRRSSPTNEFDADGSLKDVELSVMNLDNERQWRKIGCFLDETLTIDDITWPEQAERPPSGAMEKFHLRAVFLEEPSFVNLAESDTETGECKTNRAVRCRYKTVHSSHKQRDSRFVNMFPNQETKSNRSNSSHHRYEDDFEYKCCSGFSIDLMEKFATDLKFTYDLYRVPDGMWGVYENNTWNGLVEEVSKGRADVVITIKINSQRQSVVDFSVPFLDTGISILVSKQTGVISKLAFLEPFDRLAWIMFVCVGIPLAATSIFYFELLSPNGFYSEKYRGEFMPEAKFSNESGARDHFKFSFCRTLWLVITILFGSSAPINSPFGYTARFMSNVWATFAVVFLAVYTANLAAFMITREEYLMFSGINDPKLATPFNRHPPLKFGTIAGGNTHAVLRANKPNLYEYMRGFNRLSVEDGKCVEAVKTGQLDAFIYDSLVLDYMAGQDPDCKLLTVGSIYSTTGFSLAFPRNSRYYEKFNMKMLEYKKNGELDRLRRFWQQGLCRPGQNRHSISKPLDLSQFMSAFLLLGAGILCSILILVCEHIYAIYIRQILIKSRHRKRLIKLLYPFSMSLADTLRLPGDLEDIDQLAQTSNKVKRISKRYVESSTCPETICVENHSWTLDETSDGRLSRGGNLESIATTSFASNLPVSMTEFKLLRTLESYKNHLEQVERYSRRRSSLKKYNHVQHVKELMCKLENALQSMPSIKDPTPIKLESTLGENTQEDILNEMQSLDLVTRGNMRPQMRMAELSRSETRPSIKELLNHGIEMKRNDFASCLSCSKRRKTELWSSSQPEGLAMTSNIPRDNIKHHARRSWFSRPRTKSDQTDRLRLKKPGVESNLSTKNLGGNTEILL